MRECARDTGAAFSLVTFSWPNKRKSPASGCNPDDVLPEKASCSARHRGPNYVRQYPLILTTNPVMGSLDKPAARRNAFWVILHSRS